MGAVFHLFRINFINSLNEANKKEMKQIDLGSFVSVDSKCGSVLNGQLESFEEDGIILVINNKSKAVITGVSVEKIKKTEV